MAATRTLPNPGDGQTAILSFTADKFNTVLGPDTWKYALFDDSPIMNAAFDWIGGLGSLMWGTLQDSLGLTTEEPEVAAIKEGTKATKETTAAISEEPDNLKDILKEQLRVQKDILQEIRGDRFAQIEERREEGKGAVAVLGKITQPTQTTEEEEGRGIFSRILEWLGLRKLFGLGGTGAAVAAGGIGATLIGGIMAALPIIGIVALVGAALMAAFTDISLGVARASEWDTSKFSAGLGSFFGGQMDVEAGEWVRALNIGTNAMKWGLIGAAIGAIAGSGIFSIPGALIGGAIGVLLGGIAGAFAGESIATILDSKGNISSDFLGWLSEYINDHVLKALIMALPGGALLLAALPDDHPINTPDPDVGFEEQWGHSKTEAFRKVGSFGLGEGKELLDFNKETFGVESLWDTRTPEGIAGMSAYLSKLHPNDKSLYTPQMIELKTNNPEAYNKRKNEIDTVNKQKVARQEFNTQVDVHANMLPEVARIAEETGQPGMLKDYWSAIDLNTQQELKLMGISPTTMAGNIPTLETPIPGGMNILLGDLGFAGSGPGEAIGAGGSVVAGVPKEVRSMPAYRKMMAEDAINGGIPGLFTGRTP